MTRVDLHEYLKTISQNVYYQPPSTLVMKYPAIVYTKDKYIKLKAKHGVFTSYKVTVIERNPDSNVPTKLLSNEKVHHLNSYVYDGLYHDVFTIYI